LGISIKYEAPYNVSLKMEHERIYGNYGAVFRETKETPLL
jgi:hypothetical protein